MARKSAQQIKRRDFLKITSTGALGVAAGPFFLFPERAQAQQRTLKILQWSHFVPGFDKWFDGVFAKQWGEKHNTNVTVDHITAREVNARGAAEVSAGKGHDLFLFQFPPAAYEKQVIEMHNTNVTVDHITAREVNARGAAEVSAGKGHDLFLFQFPPAAYEKQVIDLTD